MPSGLIDGAQKFISDFLRYGVIAVGKCLSNLRQSIGGIFSDNFEFYQKSEEGFKCCSMAIQSAVANAVFSNLRHPLLDMMPLAVNGIDF